MSSEHLIGSCACGQVQIALTGTPIVGLTCYCDDCQAGSRQIEALPGATSVRGADSGTSYVLYRRDRFACTQGNELLKPYKIRHNSATSRVVATCCNSPMYIGFDDMRHWTPVYRARLGPLAPPVEMGICTRFKIEGAALPAEVPASKGIPFAFMTRLLGSGISMLLRR